MLNLRTASLALATTLALFVGLIASADAAHAREMTIESFDAKIAVGADSTLTIEERITVRFDGFWNGIYRHIPTQYDDRFGTKGAIRIDVQSVQVEGHGDAEYEKRRQGGMLALKIRVPGAKDATKVVVVRYTADNVMRHYGEGDSDFGGHDELYWNVTGTGWTVGIEKATALITLPEGVEQAGLKTAIHTGAYGERGATGRAKATIHSGQEIRFETTAPLSLREGLTIVVAIPPGHIELPSKWLKTWWFIEDNWYLLIPLLLVLWCLYLWNTKGRDDISDYTIIPQWEIPHDLRPAEVGILTDDRFDPPDLTATLVDLAIRRVLTIEYADKPEDTELTLNRRAMPDADLRDYESSLITELFGNTQRVKLKDKKYKFTSKLSDIRSSVEDELVERGLFPKRPTDVKGAYYGKTFLTLAACGVLGWLFSFPPMYWFALVLAGIFMFWVNRYMPQRSKLGLGALADVRGLEDYLETAERQRLEAMSLTQAESLIPYAVALGIEDKWMEAIGDIWPDQDPEWARGQSRHSLLDSVYHMNRGIGRTLYAQPRSSGSSSGGSWSGGSGFSGGGGYSGGGFGGGGGGGW